VWKSGKDSAGGRAKVELISPVVSAWMDTSQVSGEIDGALMPSSIDGWEAVTD
jgi:hypothetical protein